MSRISTALIRTCIMITFKFKRVLRELYILMIMIKFNVIISMAMSGSRPRENCRALGIIIMRTYFRSAIGTENIIASSISLSPFMITLRVSNMLRNLNKCLSSSRCAIYID